MSKFRLSRLLCCLCCFSLCFTAFGLNVSAASDNLIDNDLRTWTDGSDIDNLLEPITVSKFNNIYRIKTPASSDGSLYNCYALLDNTNIIVGHSYTLSFRMPNASEISDALGSEYSDSSYSNHFKNSQIMIGIGFINSSGDISIPDSSLLFNINKDNYTKFVGKNLNASFIASNYTGTPCVIISIINQNTSSHVFFFENFKLIDNDDNSAELSGIKGFLHSIRWDLVGGICDESDCPHSSNSNPHLSLTERMSSGFGSFFDDIGENLTSLKDSFSERVGELKTSLSSLGDRMGNFFSNLGDRISNFFSNLGDRISGFFSDLKTSLSNWVSDIGNWFSELGEKITTKFQEIGDKFTEFFEKFKPRVSLNLDWKRGIISFSDGSVTFYPSSPPYPQPYAVVTDFITVPNDSVYYLNYYHTPDNGKIVLYQYDLEGNYVRYMFDRNYSFEDFELPSGYCYRLRITVPNSVTNLNEYISDYVTVYSDEGWINALLFNLKAGIKSLFVPSEDFISSWKDNLDTLLRDHLGIIYTGGDIVTDFLTTVFNIVFDAPDTFSITFPEVEFELDGNVIHLCDSRSVDFSFLENGVFKMLYGMYKVALYIFFGVLEVKYALVVYRRVISN